MLTFAFYRAPGNMVDRVIRLGSWSIYSHVEFVLNGPDDCDNVVCMSASKRDGNKVRTTIFKMRPGHWDLVKVPGEYAAARKWAQTQIGQPYNSIAAALSVTPCRAKIGRGLFCSEYMGGIARAGGLRVPAPHTLTPQEFYNAVTAIAIP